MNTQGERDRSEFIKCFDRCVTEPCCHAEIKHWQRMREPDPRTVANGNYEELPIYTYANRPRFRRCHNCAAVMFAARRWVA